MRFYRRVRPFGRLTLLVVATLLPFTLGTAGFHLIEGTDLFESFYMTLITLTTIGYGETIELSRTGRYFNSALIMLGFVVTFVAVGVLAEYLISYRILERIREGAEKRMLRRMVGHYIICGLGRVGLGVLDQLRKEKTKVVVIDQSGGEEKASHREIEVPMLTEDATVPETLELAGVRSANGLVAALSSDADNVYITLSARVLNPGIRIVARASTTDAKNRLLQAGANRVVMPYTATGRRLAQALLRPNSSDFLEIGGSPADGEQRLEMGECHVRAGSELVGKTLEAANLPGEFGLIPLALSRGGSPPEFNPPPGSLLSEDDVVVVLGPRECIDRLVPGWRR